MRYNKLRHLIQTGDLIEWHSDSLLGRLIRARTKQDVNHTSMALEYYLKDSDDRRVCVCEALGRGTHPYFLSTRIHSFKGIVYWTRFERDDSRVKLAEEMLKLVGKPYGYWDIIKSLFHRPDLRDDKLICSEALQLALINSHLITRDFNDGKVLFPGQFDLTGLYKKIKIRIN